MNQNKFNIVNISSKFAICGIPLRADTYKTCSFGCQYCFANNRIIMGCHDIGIGNIEQLKRMLNRIFDKGKINNKNLLDKLIFGKYDWHLGGMSDPFQPIEKELKITKQMIDITNDYEIPILISTKSDNVYGANIRPDLHSFQLSVTNVNNRKDIEPNVPNIEERYKFYKTLKNDGFKVGIRIQPFIPNVSTTDIIDMFNDADNFTLEGIKLVPQNKDQKEKCLSLFDIPREEFKQMGLLNLKPEYRLKMYQPFIEKFEKLNIKYSIADNDLRRFGTNKCCCGDALIHKSTGIDCTAMIKKYGNDYTKQQIDDQLRCTGIGECKCNSVFSSNRQEGCVTVQDFYDKRFERKSSPFSPKFQYFKQQNT